MNKTPIYSDGDFYLIRHESTIPWVIVHLHEEYRELSDLPPALRRRLCDLLVLIEETMREYYRPHKINIASFGNYLPRQHWHIMARFEEDSHFPEPMWGPKQREGALSLPDFEPFALGLAERLRQAAQDARE